MRVYLDACCLSRLTDDQEQTRIREEAQAIERILLAVRVGLIGWVSSTALVDEINQNPDTKRTSGNVALLLHATEVLFSDNQIVERARGLCDSGYGLFDALHLAYAEAAHADVLLTTDDAFIRKASRGLGRPSVPVRNPLSWTQEYFP
jgi:hypothetical protein